MSKVSLVVEIKAAEGKSEELEAALQHLIATAEIEPGLEVYAANRGEDGTYWFYEVYSDEDAFAVHGKSDEMRAAMRALGQCLAGPPAVHRCTPVAAKGI